MHAAVLGAAGEGRDGLAGIEQAQGVEGGLEGVEGVDLCRSELDAHLVDLFPADPVLAGDRAAYRDAELKDGAAQGLGLLQVALQVGVVEYQGVKVAIAGVEDVGDPQAMDLRKAAHLGQDEGQGLPRDGPVDAVIVGRKSSHGGEGALAARPESSALGLVAGDAHRGGARLPKEAGDPLDLLDDVLVLAVDLTEQDGRGIPGIASTGEVLSRPKGRAIHHLKPCRHHPRRHDGRHRPGRPAHVVEGGEDQAGRLGKGLETQEHLGDHAQEPLGTGEQGHQVVAGGIACRPAQGQDLAVQGDHLSGQDVVHGQAVFQAVHTPRVLRDIAADGAGKLGGGVRGVEQAMGCRGLGDRQVADPGLDPGGHGGGVDPEDAGEL